MLRPLSLSPIPLISSFCFLVSSFPHPRILRHKYAECFQGRLLLQIDDEPSIKMELGSSGRLFFFIREQDLKAKDFTKVWAWEQ